MLVNKPILLGVLNHHQPQDLAEAVAEFGLSNDIHRVDHILMPHIFIFGLRNTTLKGVTRAP
ncbi:hypothetical protein [Ensifer soli]|uniref:hypothetical protein n=1 Tax=Ciceribacter sp. sgz301302 TaxID=3342379 RepID=UPI0035BA1F60